MSARARALAAALAVGLTCAGAFAQAPQPAPSARPAPSTAASAGTSASALPPGHPPTGASASASALPPGHPPTGASASASALPPGHPPTGDLPPGHPPTGGGDEPGHPSTGESPHGGGNPHGGGSRGGGDARSQLFDAPPDTAEDDPTLPVGTIVLTLKDAAERPIPATDVTLGILHNTVAAGESRERKSGTTDAEGTLRWNDLARGSGTSYRVSVARGKALFGTAPFTLGDRSGKRVVLHVYPVTSDLDEVLIGTQGILYLALREDSIVVENIFGIFNLGAIAWVPENETIDLPEGYKAFNRPDSMDGVGVDEVNGKGLMRGTIGPGRHDVNYRYQVSLDGDERQTFRIALPPQVAQMRVMVESAKTMNVEVQGFPAAKKTKNRDGKRVLVTEASFSRDANTRTVQITLTGLPTTGPGGRIAAVLAAAVLLYGVYYAWQRSQQSGADAETRRDLVDAREALLREIVELERAHRAGEIGPKTYNRLRGALLDALERLVTKISEATPKPSRSSRIADADEA